MNPVTPNLQCALQFRSIIKRVLVSDGAPLPTLETEKAVKEKMHSNAKKRNVPLI